MAGYEKGWTHRSGLRNVTRQASAATVIAETRDWIEKAVIGLNLCPFARAVYVNDRIRYCVSRARSEHALLADLSRELRALQAADPQTCETVLLIHPHALTDFADYNDFLGLAEADRLARSAALLLHHAALPVARAAAALVAQNAWFAHGVRSAPVMLL